MPAVECDRCETLHCICKPYHNKTGKPFEFIRAKHNRMASYIPPPLELIKAKDSLPAWCQWPISWPSQTPRHWPDVAATWWPPWRCCYGNDRRAHSGTAPPGSQRSVCHPDLGEREWESKWERIRERENKREWVRERIREWEIDLVRENERVSEREWESDWERMRERVRDSERESVRESEWESERVTER